MLKKLSITVLGVVLLSIGFFLSGPVAYADEPLVRVGISTQAASVKLSSQYGFTLIDAATGNMLFQFIPGQEVELQPVAGGVLLPVQNITASKIQAVPVTVPQGDNLLTVTVLGTSRPYRGTFEVFPNKSGKLTVVNSLPMEDYVLGVVSREMSENYPLEALKAQAVAIRNYALTNMGKHAADGFDLCSSTDCQAYSGMERVGPKVTQAVEETKGEIATYNGQPINAYFFASSGGYTENSENIWNGPPVPYLVGVPDFDQDSPDYQWQVTLSQDQVQQKLDAAKLNIGQLLGFETIKIGVSGRIATVKIKGTGGTVEVKGNQLRTYLGLKSAPKEIKQDNSSSSGSMYTYSYGDGKTAYVLSGDGQVRKIALGEDTIIINGAGEKNKLSGYKIPDQDTQPSTYTFIGGGWGHGVGMSQWGAKNMALQGYNYQDILKHYYSGISIDQLY